MVAPVIDLAATDTAIGLLLAYLDEIEALGDAVGLAVRQVFEDLAHTDRADIAEFVSGAEPYVKAGQTEAADLASAYISEMTGERVQAIDLRYPDVAFDAPFTRVWHELGQGYQYGDAKASGASVAEMTGFDSAVSGGDTRMTATKTKEGWRRILNPGACDWCQVVATQVYKTRESATFGHNNCHCRPVSVFRDNDPTEALNKIRLTELKRSGTVAKASAARERNRERKRNLITEA